MITYPIAQSAIQLSQRLNAKGQNVEGKFGSVIRLLAEKAVRDPNDDVNADGAQILMDEFRDGAATVSHSAYEQNYATDLRKYVAHLMDVAKNKIYPLAQTILHNTEAKIGNINANLLEDMPGINTITIPSFIEDPIFLALLNGQYATDGSMVLQETKDLIYSTLKLLSNEELLELGKTNSTELDGMLEKEGVFEEGYGGDPLMFNYLNNPYKAPYKHHLAEFLFINGILNHKSEKTSTLLENASALKYFYSRMVALSSYLKTLVESIKKSAYDYKHVLAFNPDLVSEQSAQNKINVYAINYLQWLNDGGTPEALVGLYLFKKRKLTRADEELLRINGNASALSQWIQEYRLALEALKNSVAYNSRNILKKEFLDVCFETINNAGANKAIDETAVKALTDRALSYTNSATTASEPEDFVLDGLCQIFYDKLSPDDSANMLFIYVKELRRLEALFSDKPLSYVVNLAVIKVTSILVLKQLQYV